MTFMQVIEYRTSRESEVAKLFDEWLSATAGKRTAVVETHTQDHEDPTHYVDIVEFRDRARALINNQLPETNLYAERLRALCEEPPRYVDLEVVRTAR